MKNLKKYLSKISIFCFATVFAIFVSCKSDVKPSGSNSGSNKNPPSGSSSNPSGSGNSNSSGNASNSSGNNSGSGGTTAKPDGNETSGSGGDTSGGNTTKPEELPADDWLSNEVPSLKEAYAKIFDSFGMACEYGLFGDNWGTQKELTKEEVQKGLAKHADSITLGNELKPQFMLQWWNDGKTGDTLQTVDFTDSNGTTVEVPETMTGFDMLSKILTICKNNNLKMRGHVLTWHSQTPDDLFAKNYKAEYTGGGTDDKSRITNLVSPAEMTARHEWYIKTILEFVADWEAKNGYGEGNHIIWAWDVVNEACADDAGQTYAGNNQNWLRGSTQETKNQAPTSYPQGSRWYQIYESDEFIVNAFRFANAYAPADVVLCYNDYNEYVDWPSDHGAWKTSAILNLLKNVRNGEEKTINGKLVKPRIDVMGMQSHVGISWPGVESYEKALKRFLAAGYDVHVSEIDFSAKTQAEATKAYSEYFEMLKKYGKNYAGTHKITNVTVWGINNEDSWIYKGDVKYPLLFTKTKSGNYLTTPSFNAVIDAAK